MHLNGMKCIPPMIGFRSACLAVMVLALIMVVGAPSADAQIHEKQEITASDGEHGDRFGTSVSVSGDVMVVGADEDEDNGYESGSAYVFRYESATDLWIQEAKLLPSDGDSDDFFGYSVSVSGDIAVVGAYRDEDVGYRAGSAYVFRHNAGTGSWNQEAKLLDSNGVNGGEFGRSVCICADVIVVGAHQADHSGLNLAGEVYVFRYDPGSETWVEEAILTASDAEDGDHFGLRVAVQDDVLLALAGNGNGNEKDTGCVYVFRYDSGTAQWVEEAKLFAPEGENGDAFGTSISLHGGTALIGDFWHKLTDHRGCAFVFRHDPATGNWDIETELVDHDGVYYDYFGETAAVYGDIALIGAHDKVPGGAVFVFRYLADKQEWFQQNRLESSGQFLSHAIGDDSLFLQGTTAFAGDEHADGQGNDNTGAVYVFDIPDFVAPVPDIKVNGLDGPLSIGPGDLVTVTMASDPGNLEGVPVDWWIHVEKDAANTWWSKFRAGLKPKWTKSATPIRFAGAGLRTVYGFTVLGPRTLPVGSYVFTFAIDAKDEEYKGTFIDTVDVTVL